MTTRSIKKVHPAVAAHMPGLSTWRAMPTQHIEWLDPFLFLNHHGPDVFRPGNRGLPFGPHPHRGFETLTYILEGELVHEDTTGYKSKITEGGVQWMTAGSGLLHSETSSEEFLREGGAVELIQLWLNLPSKLKMTPPAYSGMQSGDLVHLTPVEGVNLHLISGEIYGSKGPYPSITNLTMTWLEMNSGSEIHLPAPGNHQVLFYVVRGQVNVNGTDVSMRNIVEFNLEDGDIDVTALEDALILFGHGEPFNEPIAAHGPFVMNTYEEINQAVADYQAGKMGVWKE
ncbi:MAG: pirin family protein [Flavobacteriia bacterium]|nr:pirin family protein [Flavobacteriia bacterium]